MSYRQTFLKNAKQKHGERYSYQLLPDRFTYNTWVSIICKQHGVFEQKARTHAIGSSCPKCAYGSRQLNNYSKKRHTKEQFVERAKKVHGDFYDYSETEYVAQMKPVTIRCLSHGCFTVIANNHLHGTGCPTCKRSRGEVLIEQYLINHNINYETQKSFSDLMLPDCKKVTQRPKFDFFLPHHNLFIEYDGKHHFEPVPFNGVCYEEAQRLHERTVLSDQLKDNYVKRKGYKIYRIPYTDFHILNKKLDSFLK